MLVGPATPMRTGTPDPLLPHPAQPIQDRFGLEAKLRGDVHGEIALRRCIEFLHQHARKRRIVDFRMPVGVTRDTDLANAVFLQHVALDQVECTLELACSRVAIAGNHECARDTRFAVQPRKHLLHMGRIRIRASGEVWHRLEAGAANGTGVVDKPRGILVGRAAQIDMRAGGRRRLQGLELRLIGKRRFKRKAAQYARDVVGRGCAAAGNRLCGSVLHDQYL